jgi:hypothetical protein
MSSPVLIRNRSLVVSTNWHVRIGPKMCHCFGKVRHWTGKTGVGTLGDGTCSQGGLAAVLSAGIRGRRQRVCAPKPNRCPVRAGKACYQSLARRKGRGACAGAEARSGAFPVQGDARFSRAIRTFPARHRSKSPGGGPRIGPEWILLCLNMLAGPDCSGKCAIGPEQHGLGPENRKFASSVVGSGNNRGVARGCRPIFRGNTGHFPAQSRPAQVLDYVGGILIASPSPTTACCPWMTARSASAGRITGTTTARGR